MRLLVCIVAALNLVFILTSYTDGKVLLVSFDGFRMSYLKDYPKLTSWFHELKNNGTSAELGGMDGTFTTKTFPSHITLSTGMYEESHGIVSNTMYDPKFNANFTYKRKEDNRDPRWWAAAEPIWITATRQGKKAATFFWPGSEAPYNGVKQLIMKYYNESVPFKTRVDTVVNWLSSEGIDFASLYFHEPDRSGHRYGPKSTQIEAALSNCNDVLGYLIKKLQEANIFHTTDIVLVSDHGMSTCSTSRVINLQPILSKRRNLFEFIKNVKGPVVDIFTKKKEELYQYLKEECKNVKNCNEVKIYKKEDLPERLHYKFNRRIADIIIIANDGYSIVAVELSKTFPTTFGCHGFDNRYESMKPIFIAHGPNISTRAVIPRIQQVDVYNGLAKLLNIQPTKNNGSWTRIRRIFRNTAPEKIAGFSLYIFCILLCKIFFHEE